MSNLTHKDLYGCMTALVTPMHESGEVDYIRWQQLIKIQIKAGIQAIIVAGTTGESALLETSEFEQLLTIAVEECEGTNTRVIAQTGAIRPERVIERNEIAAKLGAEAVLVVTPYYIRTTQQGLLQHFITIADNSQLPVILYNVPGRTQNDMLASTTAKLAHHDKIIGIKEAAADIYRIKDLMNQVPDDFSVMSGNDDTFLKSMTEGASGIISVASNVRPQTLCKICDLMALGDINSAKKLDSGLENLYMMLSYQPNPIPVKYLLNRAGVIDCGIRQPLSWFKGTIVNEKAEVSAIKKEI